MQNQHNILDFFPSGTEFPCKYSLNIQIFSCKATQYYSHLTVYLPLQVELTLLASTDDPTAMDISHCPFNSDLCFDAKDTTVIYVFLRQAEASAEQQLWPYLLKYCIILPLPLERRFKNVLCQKPLCNQHC